MVKNRHF